MSEGCSAVIFSMLMEGGVRSTSCNLDFRSGGDKYSFDVVDLGRGGV